MAFPFYLFLTLTMASTTKYPGTRVQISGTEFTVPGLSFRQMRQLTESGRLDKLAQISGMLSMEQMDLALDLIHETIQRNHPEVSRDFLEESLSVADGGILLKLIFEGSGLKATSPNAASPTP